MRKKKYLFIGLNLAISTAFAAVNNNFQISNPNTPIESPTMYLVQNAAIVFDTRIDEVKDTDPRLKTIIDYSVMKDSKVSILFYSPDNLRFARKLYKVFQKYDLEVESPALTSTKNLLDVNLVKVYLDSGEKNVKYNNQSIINQSTNLINTGRTTSSTNQ